MLTPLRSASGLRDHTRHFLNLFLAACIALLAASSARALPLDPLSLTKYIDPLPLPGAMPQDGPNHYTIGMYQITQQLHSELAPSTVWGYGTSQATASYPALSIVAQRNVPIQVKWENHLPAVHLFESVNDPTIMGARPPHGGIPVVPHVHGGETEPQSDGHPFQWFTNDYTDKGTLWSHDTFTYHNGQQASTIWYHDHAWGYTRLNVYAGLAGYFLVQDPGNEPSNLPSGPYDVPLCLQDKMFNDDGSLLYPNMSVNPEHPFWGPEFFGDVMMVNGKVWPYLDVEARKYRFRFLNGSQARFFSVRLEDQQTGAPGPAFYQIGTDGGYLPCAVVLNNPANPNTRRLIIAPGERCDVIIDFAGVAPGTNLVLVNNANSPFPDGDPVDPSTSGQVMQFRVHAAGGPDGSTISTNNPMPELIPTRRRTVTLMEKAGPGGPLGMYIDGREFVDDMDVIMPKVGETELWEIVNMTMDTHPMHLHLVQFLPYSRQAFNSMAFTTEFDIQNPVIPVPMGGMYNPVPFEPYLSGTPFAPEANERGWKDTFRCNPGEVSRILVRFAPQDGGSFPFDATSGPYVTHCHILEHEENDMMRPYQLTAAGAPGSPVLTPADIPDPLVGEEYYCNTATPVQLALVTGLVQDGAIHLDWYSPDAATVASLYRRTASDAWARLGTLAADGTGHLVYDDRDATPGQSYGYRLGVVEGGTERFFGEAWVELPLDSRFAFERPTPNPTAGDASLRFSLSREGHVRLAVYDAGGRKVRELANGAFPAGPHGLTWDGRDADGRTVSNGLYFIRFEAQGQVITQRLARIQ